MKLHIITVGKPKLAYALAGWNEYRQRLEHYHRLRITHLADKQSSVADFLTAAGTSYKVALCIEGQQFSSPEMARWLQERALAGREVSLLIGGPDGLPPPAIAQADFRWSLSALTFPHDLAMLLVSESLYRASTINAGHPYHR